MKSQRVFTLCLVCVMPGCGGNQAAPVSSPAPLASTAPPPAVEYKADFSKGSADKWTPLYGNWWVKDGVYQQDDERLEWTKTMLELPDSDCYTLKFKANKPRFTSGAMAAIVRYQKKYVRWELGSPSNTSSGVVGIDNPEETGRSFYFDEKKPYEIKIVVNGERLIGWLNGAQQWSIRRAPAQVKGLDAQDAAKGKDLVGLIGLGTFRTHVEFTDVTVTPVCQ